MSHSTLSEKTTTSRKKLIGEKTAINSMAGHWYKRAVNSVTVFKHVV